LGIAPVPVFCGVNAVELGEFAKIYSKSLDYFIR